MLKTVLVILISLSSFANDKQTIILYTYHNKPPFITDLEAKKGLSFDFSKALSKVSKKYNFKVQYLPRKRLNLMKEKRIVLWSNPDWEKDSKKEKYYWSSPIMSDSDVYISNTQNIINITTPNDLVNLTLTSVRGYVYPTLTYLFEGNLTKRNDVTSEIQIIKAVDSNRSKLGLVSLSTLNYFYANVKKYQESIYYSKIPQDSFNRSISFTKDLVNVHKHINMLIKDHDKRKEINKAFIKNGQSLSEL